MLTLPRHFVAAHRGSHGDSIVENTIAAFEDAIRLGADAIELDVWPTRDGDLAVYHDDRIGDRPVTQFTLDELRRETQRDVPSFRDVARQLARRVFLDVEVKDPAAVDRVLQALVDASWTEPEFVITSFDRETLRRVRDRNPRVQIGLLVDADRQLPPEVDAVAGGIADFVAPHEQLLTAEALRYCATRNVRVVAWTVNQPGRLRALFSDPAVEGVITDRVSTALEERPTGASPDEALDAERRLIAIRRRRMNGPNDRDYVGLAFSGGGIRSATLSLGVIQALSDLGLLPVVDYLSTVSGGGYIGSWLHGVILHLYGGKPEEAQRDLSPEANRVPGEPQVDPVSFLRKYSNYLAPRPGAYSADSWVIALIWLRNVLLNQLILIPALGVALLVPLIVVFVRYSIDHHAEETGSVPLVGALVTIVTLAVAGVIMWKNLDAIVEQEFRRKDVEGPAEPRVAAEARRGANRYTSLAVALIFSAAVVLAFSPPLPAMRVGVVIAVASMLGLLQLKGGFIECYESLHPPKANSPNLHLSYVWAALMIAAASALTIVLIRGVWSLVDRSVSPEFQPTFAPPLMTLSLVAGMTFLTGLMGADYPDAAREWISSVSARLALLSAAWVGWFLIALYGPWLFARALGEYGRTTLVAVGGWIMTVVGGVLAGRSDKTGSPDAAQQRSVLDWLVMIAPPAFMVGYLLLIAFGVHEAFVATMGNQPSPCVPTPRAGRLFAVREWACTYESTLTDPGEFPWRLLAILGGAAVVAWIAGMRININEFSMHHFYKNRLVRCYLGASRGAKRNANKLTGFDPADDFPIAKLRPPRYLGPCPIVNIAMNVNVGIELAQQERKAQAFVMTPAYCGFAPSKSDEHETTVKAWDDYAPNNGYRRTTAYGGRGGLSMGSAVAISGAAANPNSGYATSGPMAFLLTVFDARLGWWLGNPRWRLASERSGPAFALWYLLAELLGRATARKRFVNLSDGGHFDNLGLYELVRRRCRYIVIVDGEEDGQLTFGSLGGAIRKCRADFGVEIDINPDPIRLGARKFSGAHCVMGTITYPEAADPTIKLIDEDVEAATDRNRAWLFYLKSSLTGDEPADVIEYHSRNHEFPHQSTADQFFSESQFESYRRLGLHLARSAFEDVLPWQAHGGGAVDVATVFRRLTRKWYAPISVTPEAASRLADAYSSLMRTLRERPDLEPLLPCLLGLPAGRQQPDINDREQLLFITEVLQLMENVFTEYRFEQAANRTNPRSAGWMRVFRMWTNPHQFLYTQAWQLLRSNYNTLFQEFVETLATTEREPHDVPNRP